MHHHILDIQYQDRRVRVTTIIPEVGDHLYYDLYHQGEMLGTIWPTLGKEPFTVWVGDQALNPVLVQSVGVAIENQDW